MLKHLAALLLLTGTTFAQGKLDFPETRKDIKADAATKIVEADFAFSNKTKSDLTIARYEGTCSCMKVEVKGGKLTYAPGETGTIHATFDLENFSGVVDKAVAIYLKGDPDDAPSTTLTAHITIPVLIVFEPNKTLRWTIDEAAKAKSFDITVHHDKPIHLLSVSSSNPIFTAEIKTIEDGKHYQLTVTPSDTKDPALAVFRIETDCDIAKQKQQQAFAVTSKVAPPPVQ